MAKFLVKSIKLTFRAVFVLIGFIAVLDKQVSAEQVLYQWTKTVGGTGSDVGRSVKVDSSGNPYVAGYFNSTVDFDPSEGNDSRTSYGSEDSFLSKFLSDGTYQWTRATGGTSSDRNYTISIGNDGVVYLSGIFKNTVDFDPSGGIDSRTSAGDYDIALGKYLSSGEYQWTKTLGSAGSDNGYGVANDSNGNVYFSGYFTNTIDFDPSAGVDNHISNGVQDIFLSKYSSTGEYLWTRTFGGTGMDYGYSIDVDSQSNVYITGWYSNTVDFDPSIAIDNRTSNGGEDIYLVKFSQDGIYQWVNAIGSSGNDDAYSLKIDTLGNLYISGRFSNIMDFNPGPEIDLHDGVSDVFLSKYNIDGTYQWTVTFGGNTGFDTGQSVSVDSDGYIYICGNFQNTVDFDPSEENDIRTSSGSSDIFINKFSSSEEYQWTKTVGGTGNDQCFSIDLNSGEVYITGGFNNIVDFDFTDNADTHTSNGGNDIFVTKLIDDDDPPGVTFISPAEGTDDTTPTIKGTATDPYSTVSSVEYQVDSTSGTWIICTADDGAFDEASEEFTCEVTTELSYGDHTVYIRTSDAFGNVSSEETFELSMLVLEILPKTGEVIWHVMMLGLLIVVAVGVMQISKCKFQNDNLKFKMNRRLIRLTRLT